MKLVSAGFQNNGAIPGDYAFCVIDPVNHLAMSKNRNPPLAWSEVPAAVRSFVLLCHDYDVPSVGDDVNREGRSIAATLPRVDFYHWVLVDLPADVRSNAGGEFSDGVTAHGKPGPAAPRGTRQGINDYTGWFASDPGMAGNYHGYDGCCPPWNDEILHHYVFTLYALDIARCPVEGVFKGPQVRAAIQGHVLAEATLTGVYSLNPALKY